MLGLTLRKEFQGKRLKGTAIELANEKNTGATQIAASDFLDITYPSSDLLKCIDAVGPGQGRPLVLIGERGQGKSHLLAALYHTLTDSASTKSWLEAWADRLGQPKIASLTLRQGVKVIGESLHRQRYKFLWDLLFEQHPHGQFIKGKWEGLGDKKTDVPSDTLIVEMLKKQPMALLLDEFQTWYDGLKETKQQPWKQWAFNFVQILSEIAKEHPELLVLVVSVRNGSTDAYQQIHRVNPVLVDFKGPNAERDRRRLLLHRLFENRSQVSPADIDKLLKAHVSEYLRLLDTPPSEHDRKRREFSEMWPFAPHLMQLLEDQVLVATDAQETRDLIRILAEVFKSRGNSVPVITAADFRLDDDASGIAALLDSVSNQHHASLREKAQRNLTAVAQAVKDPDAETPHLSEIVGALWLRSLAVGNHAGAEPSVLQVDITRTKPIDDNVFQVEMSLISENSFNIHPVGERLVFREEENPQAKLMAFAKNDRLFSDGADERQLALETRYVLAGQDDSTPKAFRVVVLPSQWTRDPWGEIDENDRPDRWDDRLPIVVLPTAPDELNETLGAWLKEHLQRKRNVVRFLLPRGGSSNAYLDRDLLVLSRATLKAREWREQSPEYTRLLTKYQGDLRALLKQRFDRFALLRSWSFTDPSRSRFHVETLGVQGSKIPEAIEETIRNDIFVPEDFSAFILNAAAANESVGKVLRELQEPRPNEETCIPWLGETLIKERIIRICARGEIAINVRSLEWLQAAPGEDEETAWRRMRGRLSTGKHLDETFILLPTAVPQADVVSGPVIIDPNAPGPTALGPAPQGSAPIAGVPGASPPVVTPPSGPSPSGIFQQPTPAAIQSHSAAATSALNLIGKVEGWGIGPATSVRSVNIKLSAATGAQLQKLLRGLPDGLTYELSLEKEE